MGWFIAAIVVCMGSFLGGYTQGIMDSTTEKIMKCQKELPRNEYCEIIAVPKKLDNKDK